MHYFSNLLDKVLYMFRTVDLSETCRVLHQINLRNRASPWFLLQEYITMYVPLDVKFALYIFTAVSNVIHQPGYLSCLILHFRLPFSVSLRMC